MAISERDKRSWERQVAALEQIEQPPGAQITGEARRELVASVNERRRRAGRPELVNDEDEFPEIGFYRLAFARGMLS